MTLEDVDVELSNGAEFTYAKGTHVEVHQLKRQDGSNNYWSVKSLARLRIFEAAAEHVAAGRQYHFVSLIPSGPLRELTERARKSADVAAFTQSWLTEALRSIFDELSAPGILGSPEKAWTTLRGMWFEVHDEADVVQVNSMLAALSLEGTTGHSVSLALGAILLDNLGMRLTRPILLSQLADQGMRPLTAGSRSTVHEQIHAVTQSWLGTIRRELLQPPVEREEARGLIGALHGDRLGLVVGTAGSGKSSVLEQSVTTLTSGSAEVLGFRLDRLGPFASTVELGRQLGLETSPAAALAVAANGGEAYLVIDQLDAVSLASGRIPESLDVVVDLIGEALSVAGMRVILACREFDVDNDHRIRALANRPDVRKVQVGKLPATAVDTALKAMGLDPNHLTASQRELLQTPLHLVLLNTVADQDEAPSFQSQGSLFESFWERKRRAARVRRNGVRFNDVIAGLANAASDRQTLSIPIEVLDDGDLADDADVLVSEHVLAREGNRIAFFHESFFDYAFARLWVSRRECLIDFLCRDEQELFRRGQVRQILQHLREREHGRFIEEVEAALTSQGVRFHIKETVLAVVASVADPTAEEAALLLRVSDTRPRFEDHLWLQLRRPQWFQRFHADGLIATWLDSDDQILRERAIESMSSGVNQHGESVAALLATRQSASDYLSWLRRIFLHAHAHTNRMLFDLLLEIVRQGAYDGTEDGLWLTVQDLAKHQPMWAIELLQALLVDHMDGLTTGEYGTVAVLGITDHGACEMVREASAAEPLAFVETIVPYLRDVMTVTAYEPKKDRCIRDRHFSLRVPGSGTSERDLGDALFSASARALETLARSTPESIRSLLESLACDPYHASQLLLYRALAAAGETFSEWAAALLLEDNRRLDSGYVSDGRWLAREVVTAIAGHINGERHQELERRFRDLVNPYESGPSSGRLAFTFLSALAENRLTPQGVRRLNEYRRKFHQDFPSAPRGIEGGFIGSPIAPSRASKLTDDQWLRAMAKYDSDRTDWDTLTGGARELSTVLQQQVKEAPARFAQLALRLSVDVNPAYGDAILIGLGEASENAGYPGTLAFDAIRHIASLGHQDHDRWLGTALRQHYKEAPIDLVELIRDRALRSPDPTDESSILSQERDDSMDAKDLRHNGINTARGSLAEALGDLLVYDVDGSRTEVVRPWLGNLASDPSVYVRACVAHTLAAALRHARPDVLVAFERLVDADDRLLASDLVERLMLYIGNVNPEVIIPVIHRMLNSDYDESRAAGGALAAFGALEWGLIDLMPRALSADVKVRRGVADVVAARIDRTSNVELATSSLMTLMHDDDDDVREAVAQVAPHLRDQRLRPFADLLDALIRSPSYSHATPQLLLTLEHAPDKVDDLALKAAQRFLEVYGHEAADIRTGAAGDARYISELVVRGLAQSRDRAHRSALLDVLDRLLELGVYGVGKAISQSERV
ncbi:hypothetical protein [Myceligenerans pegani]|uniref:hypothetical protein n=1 Tax=Myceligenerans pegani TaxID=2776917 RepID=UPI001CEFBC6F|nr:hypothetical protein [Myceligenerans sp. TRM 65318]